MVENDKCPPVYVAVALYYWGKGSTADEAKIKLKAAGYRARGKNAGLEDRTADGLEGCSGEILGPGRRRVGTYKVVAK